MLRSRPWRRGSTQDGSGDHCTKEIHSSLRDLSVDPVDHFVATDLRKLCRSETSTHRPTYLHIKKHTGQCAHTMLHWLLCPDMGVRRNFRTAAKFKIFIR